MTRLYRIALSLLFCVVGATVWAAPKPNIIVIMSDDMGYSDVGCYGGEISTPNLDALAANGLRFTQFYNTARCCPTRATLLTGLYAHQAGIGHMMDDHSANAGAAYTGELSDRAVTFAEALRGTGYSTCMTGKWHVTKMTKPQTDSDKFNWPLQRGFDRFYGTIHGGGSFFDPTSLVRDNDLVSPFADPQYKPPAEYYYTDAISDHAVRFVTDHRRAHPQQPFLMYVAYTAAHWPMHAKEADIAKYRGKYDGGYDAIRSARLAKMKQLGLLDPRWQLTPQAGDWSRVKNKPWETRCMEVYAAMVDCMDQGIGRLVSALKDNGQLDNTVILYLQDNGGCAETMGRLGPNKERADKPTLPPMAASELQPDMIPKQTRDGFPVRQGNGVMPGGADTFIGYGQAWANVSNTPFREYKHWEHEGGISTPLIAHWPAGMKDVKKGGFVREPAHLIDVMATCVDLAGASYPDKRGNESIQPLQGRSLAPVFSGKAISEKPRPLFWEHEGNRALRLGDWKLVSKHNQPWELYDMAADRTEMHDVATDQPERVKAMAAQWEAWAKSVGVAPWPLEKQAGKKKKKN